MNMKKENSEQEYDSYGGNWVGCEITPQGGFRVYDHQKWASAPEMKETLRKFKEWENKTKQNDE